MLPEARESGGSALELADLGDRLARAKKAEQSHYVWTMVGASPVGLLVLFSFVQGGLESLPWLVLFLAAFVAQFVRWRRADSEVERLEAELDRRTQGDPDGPVG